VRLGVQTPVLKKKGAYNKGLSVTLL
jgi:hypothetical protein